MANVMLLKEREWKSSFSGTENLISKPEVV